MFLLQFLKTIVFLENDIDVWQDLKERFSTVGRLDTSILYIWSRHQL